MKYSYNWIQDYLTNLPSPEALASDITALGAEVEEISQAIDDWVIVTEILKIKSHPNADKLKIAVVNTGKEQLQIVCGAPNIEVGQKVPLAQVGSKIEDTIITEVEIRGQKSYGMLCSQKELGIGDDQFGIYILDNQLEVGTRLNQTLIYDTIFQVEVTPNRGDLLSHLGVARDLGAKYNQTPTKTPISLTMDNRKAVDELRVEITDPKACPKYYARVIKGITIQESPEWLRNRLISIGLKPINNIVDVTNYIMADLGQPLHVFDFDKIKNQQIIVRRARSNETITALDQRSYNLTNHDLVIADHGSAIALAGIMGAADTSITEETTNIVLEAAIFDPIVIRRSSKRLDLSSDASYRFERGVDNGLVEYSLNKATDLVVKTAGGHILSGIVKQEIALKPLTIEINYDKINNLLGLALSSDEIDRYLRRFGFEVDTGQALVPSFRHDTHSWQDLAEEIGRLYGLDKIKRALLPKFGKPERSRYYFKEWLKDRLINIGLTESINYPFMSDHDVSALGIDIKSALQVQNPVQPENKYLRQSLFGGLAKLVARNSSFGHILAFEIGEIFNKDQEMTSLGIIIASQGQADVRAIADDIHKQFPEIQLDLVDQARFRYKFRKNFVFFGEIEIDLLKNYFGNTNIKWPSADILYRPVSKYPSINRDIAIVVSNKIDVNNIRKSIFDSSRFVNRVELFDVYKSDQLGAGNKSLAFHIDLQDLMRTMIYSEADNIVREIIAKLKKEFNAKLRG